VSSRSARRIAWVAVFLILATVPFTGGKFGTYLATRVLLLGMFAIGYDLLLGQTGLLSFGQGAFYAVGAYGLGLFSMNVTSNPLVAVAVGVAVAAAVACVIGFFCVRSTEVYFSMLTLAFGMMIFALVWNARDITGGDDGLIGIPRAPIRLGGFQIPIARGDEFYFFVLAWFALALWVAARIRHSPFGLVLAGIRENAVRTQFAGVPVRRYRLAVFVISGAFAGLAGSLEAMLESSARPTMAHWTHSAEPMLVGLLGGIGTLTGPLVGSLVFIAMREIIQRFTENWMLAFGIVLLLIIGAFRGGIVGTLAQVWERRRARDAPAAPGPLAPGAGAKGEASSWET